MTYDVVIVGGGIMGASAAYYLSLKGQKVALLDQSDIPNPLAASGDHARVFRYTYGKDSFYTELGARALLLWKDFQQEAKEELFVETGVLDLATKEGGYEEHCFKTLRAMKLPVFKLGQAEIRERYRIFNARAMRFAVLHTEGGFLWAQRAVGAYAAAALRKHAMIQKQCKIASISMSKEGVKEIRDNHGRTWKGAAYLFTPGPWAKELLAKQRLPLKTTRQRLLYFRPPNNQGRYRPAHCPVYSSRDKGFYGFPVHIHGFMKVGYHKPGQPAKPDSSAPATDPKFVRSCRTFLKNFIPDLAGFADMEEKVCYYNNTPDNDFIVDRLGDAPNAYVATGFSGHGFKFAPLVATSLIELMINGRTELNLARFKLARFK